MSSARVLTRVLPLALAVATAGVVAAQAQTAPWPSAPQQPQPPQAAPWPTQPAGPAAPAAMPAQPGMMMGGPGPTPEQQECLRNFTGYRQEVEKRAKAAEAEAKKKPTRERMCELVTVYSAAEGKWLKYSETNMARCGIPRQAIEQIKMVHTHTLDAKKKLCAAGPQQAAPAAPSLSDALGSTLTPQTDEEKKHKAGGTMDTLTGPVLTR